MLVAEPLHVVTRRFTDMIAIDDPEVAAARVFIHNHAAEPIGVDHVVRHLQIPRRNIEIRFQNLVGRTPHAELQRACLQRDRRFLIETDLPIPEIAEAVGYRTARYFIQVFRKEHGATPARYFTHAPIGYVRSENTLVKDPDEQVRNFVEMIFAKFIERGSLCGVVRYLRDENLTVPLRDHRGPQKGKLQW